MEIYHRKSDMLAPPELKKVHPLGKAPVVTVTPPGATEPIVLAESGFILQYLCDHFAENKKSIVPARWKEGQEGKIGGETEAWLRYQYLMYYSEGSFMPNFVQYLVLSGMFFLFCIKRNRWRGFASCTSCTDPLFSSEITSGALPGAANFYGHCQQGHFYLRYAQYQDTPGFPGATAIDVGRSLPDRSRTYGGGHPVELPVAGWSARTG